MPELVPMGMEASREAAAPAPVAMALPPAPIGIATAAPVPVVRRTVRPRRAPVRPPVNETSAPAASVPQRAVVPVAARPIEIDASLIGGINPRARGAAIHGR